MPDGHARADFLGEAEQVELGAEFAVVTLLGFLQMVEVRLEVGLGGEGRAVDALEHGALLVAAPVGAGHGQELDRLDQARGRHVGTAAQVGERPVAIEGDLVAHDVLVHDFELVDLALGGEKRLGVGLGHGGAGKRHVGLDAFAHLGLDGFEVFRGEGALEGEIVVEAVFDGRADGDLGRGEEFFDGLGHDMGGGVANDRQAGGGVGGDESEFAGAFRQGRGQVAGLPIDEAGHGVFEALSGNNARKRQAARFAGLRFQDFVIDRDLHVAFSERDAPIL